jgi:MFS transporter, DHA1 family, tetracycline resistance protein
MAENSQKNVLMVIFFIVFVDLLGFGILIPVIPLLLADPASPYFLLTGGAASLAQGYILLGLLTAIYPLMMFLSAPILGQLSDRYGRKKLLAFSVAGSVVAYLIFAIGIVLRNLPLLFLARAFDGFTGGNIAIAQACIADVTAPKDRAKNFGLVGAAFGLGFIIGPFIGGVLSSPTIVKWFSASTPFYFAACLSFFELMLIIFVLPETLKEKIKNAPLKLLKSVSNIIEVYKHKSVRAILSTVFLFQMGFTFFTSFIAVYYISRFGFTQTTIGNLFAYIGIWIAFTQLFITRKLPQDKEYPILRIGLIGTAVMLFFVIIPTAPWQLLIIYPLFAIFNGITQAYITGLVSRSADSSIQGQILGINSSVSALAQVLPPIIAGYLAASFAPVIPLYIAVAVVLFSAVVFWKFCKAPPDKLVGAEKDAAVAAHS